MFKPLRPAKVNRLPMIKQRKAPIAHKPSSDILARNTKRIPAAMADIPVIKVVCGSILISF